MPRCWAFWRSAWCAVALRCKGWTTASTALCLAGGFRPGRSTKRASPYRAVGCVDCHADRPIKAAWACSKLLAVSGRLSRPGAANSDVDVLRRRPWPTACAPCAWPALRVADGSLTTLDEVLAGNAAGGDEAGWVTPMLFGVIPRPTGCVRGIHIAGPGGPTIGRCLSFGSMTR